MLPSNPPTTPMTAPIAAQNEFAEGRTSECHDLGRRMRWINHVLADDVLGLRNPQIARHAAIAKMMNDTQTGTLSVPICTGSRSMARVSWPTAINAKRAPETYSYRGMVFLL